MPFFFFIQLLLNGIIAGTIYSMVSAGIALIYTTNKFINFAQGGIIVLSAYLTYVLSEMVGLQFIVACAITIALIALSGYACGLGIERLRDAGASNLILLLASICMLVMIENCLLLVFGPGSLGYAHIAMPQSMDLLGAIITKTEVLVILISLSLLMVLSGFIHMTMAGRKIRAVSDEPTLSEAIGIGTQRIRNLALVIASVIAGIAGILLGLEYMIQPFMGTGLIMKGFAGAIIGGVTSIGGAVVGAMLVGITENIGIAFLPSQFKDAIAFLLLFLFLLVRPTGLFGGRR